MKTAFLSVLLAAGFLLLPMYASAEPQGTYGGMGGGGMGMMGGSPGGGGPGGGPMMGGGMYGYGMHGYGRGGCDHEGRWGMGLEHFRYLNLNPDQLSKMNRIRLDLQKQEWSLKGKTFDARASLYDLYNTDRPDPKKIGAVYGQLFDIKRQMIEAEINAMNQARSLLNKDQLDKLRQLQQQDEFGDCSMHEQMRGQGMMGW